ncbi:hypothetical protein HH1059_16690 [Halorhodospira halochloris]|uniref:Uncharacterized protein n=1 Tax=Halorhodospira halochloris TaxID=1052 RepID=A0A2Z6EZQ5_HALHR|nr:hypothetical protein HH1059_16690 [Halorhodospira halochloris]
MAGNVMEYPFQDSYILIGHLYKLPRSYYLPRCGGRRESIPGGSLAPSLAPRPPHRADNGSGADYMKPVGLFI